MKVHLFIPLSDSDNVRAIIVFLNYISIKFKKNKFKQDSICEFRNDIQGGNLNSYLQKKNAARPAIIQVHRYVLCTPVILRQG